MQHIADTGHWRFWFRALNMHKEKKMARLAGRTVVSLLGLTMVLALTVSLGTNLVFAQCTYVGIVSADSPIAYWRLGEASGATASNSGSLGATVDGTYMNGVSQGVPGLIVGDSDFAAGFDGNDDFVSIPNHDQINLVGPYTAKTVELWFTANAPLAALDPLDLLANKQVLYEQGGITNGFNIFLDGNQLYVGAWQATQGTWVGTPINPDTTYHVTLVFDATGATPTVEGYLNGASFGSLQDPSLSSIPGHVGLIGIGGADDETRFSNSLAIANDGSGGRGAYFNGTIDEVALYNEVLPPASILLHAQGCGSVPDAVDLAISKNDGGGSTTPGADITYTLSYANNGSANASSVVITDTVPANTTFNADGSSSGWSCTDNSPAGTPCTFTVGDVFTGTGSTVDFAVTVDDPVPAGVTEISNTASIGDDGASGADLNPTDNEGSDSTPVSAAPDLALTKTDGGISTTPSNVVTYTLSYANNGDQDATGVIISDTAPANTAFDAGSSTAGWQQVVATNVYTFDVGSLSVSTNGTVVFAVIVDNPMPAGVTEISNTASIADDGTNGPDQDPGNNQGTDTTPVVDVPDLALAVTDGGITTTPGGVVAYSLNYSNNGSQGATGVVISDTLPSNTTFNATASSAGWQQVDTTNVYTLKVGGLSAGALGATASGSVTFAVTVDNPLPAGVTQITNVATISDDGSNGPDLNSNDNTGSDTTRIQYPSPAPPPSIDDDDDDDDSSGPPPAPPPSQPASAPAPTPAVIYLPETGVGSLGVDPSVWPFVAVPGLALLLGWATYRRRDK
jgi:uncharacterized repeat protein (TIGR01451 family)